VAPPLLISLEGRYSGFVTPPFVTFGSAFSIIDTVYRLRKPSERAEFDRKVEDWGAKCYHATVELVEPPRMLTEEMLRDYLARFMEHVEVDDEEYARQRFVDVFQIGWNIERVYWEEDA